MHGKTRWPVVVVGILLAPPAPARAEKALELVLDASGSMNARLPSGETRLAAAKKAVADAVAALAADTTLALRAYEQTWPRRRFASAVRSFAGLASPSKNSSRRAGLARRAALRLGAGSPGHDFCKIPQRRK